MKTEIKASKPIQKHVITITVQYTHDFDETVDVENVTTDVRAP